MNEVLLALLGFSLGVLATILTQVVSRRYRLADAKRKRRLEGLQCVRAWVEAYRALFKCKYPELLELVFANKYLRPADDNLLCDHTAPLRVYQALKEFQQANARYEEAARLGWEALETLGKRTRLDGVIVGIQHLATHQPLDLLLYPRGFPRVIAPFLAELSEQRYKLFDAFPERCTLWIDWDKLEYVEPLAVHTIVHSRIVDSSNTDLSEEMRREYLAKEIAVADARDSVSVHRYRAERAIDSINALIRQYEGKWLTPAAEA